jgi:hypothetical protein
MVLRHQRKYHLSYSLVELLKIRSMQQDKPVIVSSARVILHLQGIVMSNLHDLPEDGLLVGCLKEKLDGFTLGFNH